MRNARTAHTLRHWKIHLNDWVVDFLKEEEYCTPDKIIERDSWSTRKRRDYANSVVDRMEEAGEIKKLHRDFKNEINNAQNAHVYVSGSKGFGYTYANDTSQKSRTEYASD